MATDHTDTDGTQAMTLDILNRYADVVGQAAETLANEVANLYEARAVLKSIIPTLLDALPKDPPQG